jgi:PAS domain S-box-containing protein
MTHVAAPAESEAVLSPAAAHVPEARSDPALPSIDRALLNAALAINEAAGLDDSLAILADVGRELLGADRVSVAVWNEELTEGVIRAAAGIGPSNVGSTVRVDPSEHAHEVLAGKPVILGGRAAQGLEPKLAAAYAELATGVSVPFLAEGAPLVTFHAGWRRDRADAELEDAVEILRTLGALSRVANRMERERVAQRDRARFDAVVNSVADGVVVRTVDGIVLNTTAQRLLELDRLAPLEDPPDLNGDDHPLSSSELLAFLALELPEERHFRHRVVLASGREIVLDGTVSPILEPEGRSGSVATFRDVTAEHKREFLTEQLLERLFDTLPVAIAVAEPSEYELLSVNEAFYQLTGYPEDEVIGCRPPYPWLVPEGDVERIAAQPANQAVETLFRNKEGQLIPVAVKRFRIPGPDGEPVAIVGLITDMSEQRRFEQQLAQSGKLATIGELAAGVAHEINNPLFAILGLVEFLLKEAEPETKAHDRLVLVHQTGLEIKEIVRALLDFAREPSEERAVVSVRDAAHETLELFRRTSAAKAIELVERYDGDETPVVGSPNQLKQIFLNLVTNASQALAGEGTVELSVRREGDWVVAAVSDDGPGIPPEALARIFEPFFTTKRASGGSGLGLSVSHGIAAAHGGSLTAENRPQGGASFILKLPVRETL